MKNSKKAAKGENYYYNEGIVPLWEGDTVYDESVMFTADQDGTVRPRSLVYEADRILRVRSSDFSTEYVEGRDYGIVNCKLSRPEGSRIPLTSWEDMHPAEKNDNSKPGTWGGYLLYDEHLAQRQVLVTYVHRDAYHGPAIADESRKFRRTLSILENGGDLKVLFYGDSITTGCCASSFWKTEPMLPIFPEAVCEVLRRRYPKAKVEYFNTAVGGKTVHWGVDSAAERLIPYKADLVVIAFGMNGADRSDTDYKNFNLQLIKDARKANPDCEILFVSTTLPNEAFKRFFANQPRYIGVLREIAARRKGVGVADMTSIHRYVLDRKPFCDQSGNNINHPNDFISRLYTQVIIHTLTGKDGI